MAEVLREIDEVKTTAGEVLSDLVGSLVTIDEIPKSQEPGEEIIYLRGYQLIIPYYALPTEAVIIGH